MGRLSDNYVAALYFAHRQTIIANNLSVVETPFIRKLLSGLPILKCSKYVYKKGKFHTSLLAVGVGAKVL